MKLPELSKIKPDFKGLLRKKQSKEKKTEENPSQKSEEKDLRELQEETLKEDIKKLEIPEEWKKVFQFYSLAKTDKEVISLILQWSRTNLDFIDFLKAQTNTSGEEIAKTLAKLFGKEYADKVEEEIIDRKPQVYLLVGKSGKTYSFINKEADVTLPSLK
jgi:hypothetical protein